MWDLWYLNTMVVGGYSFGTQFQRAHKNAMKQPGYQIYFGEWQ